MRRALRTLAALSVLTIMGGGCAFDPPEATPIDAPDARPDLTIDLSADLPATTHDHAPDLPTAPDSAPDLPTTAPDEAPDDAPDQPPVETRCGGIVIDLTRDPSHCGQCDRACDARFGRCEGGQCACDAGLSACGARGCVDTRLDANHCGQCGVRCGPGERCLLGQCVCRQGFTRCAGECVDMQIDPLHCGQCDNACGDERCERGDCKGGRWCGFAMGRCELSGVGVACTPTTRNDLYCRNLSNLDALQCGDRCDGDAVCAQLDRFGPTRCERFRPGRGCDSCPCDDCDRGQECQRAPSPAAGVLCVGG